MANPLTAHYAATLDEIRAQGLFKSERIITSPQSAEITLADGRTVLNFCANNYLGLADHPDVIQAAKDATMQLGVDLRGPPLLPQLGQAFVLEGADHGRT